MRFEFIQFFEWIGLIVSRDPYTHVGADVQVKRKNMDTVLHMAASHGFVGIAKKVVAGGKANLDAKNMDRMTPLHCAARMDREEMIHLLINKYEICICYSVDLAI